MVEKFIEGVPEGVELASFKKIVKSEFNIGDRRFYYLYKELKQKPLLFKTGGSVRARAVLGSLQRTA
jgi:hypothetical protein